MIFVLVVIGNVLSKSETLPLSRAVFHVSWYDVGEAALEGLNGVDLVNNGFDKDDRTETNTVWYDPALISIDDMEKALKDAGTYLDTAR